MTTRQTRATSGKSAQEVSDTLSDPSNYLFDSPEVKRTTTRSAARKPDSTKSEVMEKGNAAVVLANVFKDEALTRKFNEFVEERCSTFASYLFLVDSRLHTMDMVINSDVTEALGAFPWEEIECSVKQLVVTMDRYFPKTKTSPGTPYDLKQLHIVLTGNFVFLISQIWEIHRLTMSEDQFTHVQALFPHLHKLLKYLPSCSQIQILKLLKTWYSVYNHKLAALAGKVVTTELSKCYYMAVGDYQQLFYLGVLLGLLWRPSAGEVKDFAFQSGFKHDLHEICSIFENAQSEADLRSLEYAHYFATLISEKHGIHRRIFSFAILDSSFGHQLKAGPPSKVPLVNPFHLCGDDSLWRLHFNIGSQTVSFELDLSNGHRLFIRIPTTDISFVSGQFNIAENPVVILVIANPIRHYVGSQIARESVELSYCDCLTFHLRAPKLPKRTLLVEALNRCFESRRTASDFCEEIVPCEHDQNVQAPLPSTEIGQLPIWTRKAEEETFRDSLVDFQVLKKSSLYDCVEMEIKSEPSSSLSVVNEADEATPSPNTRKSKSIISTPERISSLRRCSVKSGSGTIDVTVSSNSGNMDVKLSEPLVLVPNSSSPSSSSSPYLAPRSRRSSSYATLSQSSLTHGSDYSNGLPASKSPSPTRSVEHAPRATRSQTTRNFAV